MGNKLLSELGDDGKSNIKPQPDIRFINSDDSDSINSDDVVLVRSISVWWKLMSFIACFYISSQQESLKFEIWSLTSNLSPGSFPRGISPSLITILPRDGQCIV